MRVEPEEPSFDPAEWADGDETRLLAEGIRLFNDSRYYDAHEAFERVWLSTQGPDSDFYKGLIQAAICLHHFADGNLDGARGLYSGHRRYLASYLPHHLGVDVAGLLDAVQAFLRPVLRAGPDERVAFDAASAPRIAIAV